MKWTEQDDAKVMELYRTNCHIRLISKLMGRSADAINKRVERLRKAKMSK